MYYQSKNKKRIKEPNRHTRAAEKIMFSIPSRCTTKFLNISYCVGTQIWNNLSGDTQWTENALEFEKKILPLYEPYQGQNI